MPTILFFLLSILSVSRLWNSSDYFPQLDWLRFYFHCHIFIGRHVNFFILISRRFLVSEMLRGRTTSTMKTFQLGDLPMALLGLIYWNF